MSPTSARILLVDDDPVYREATAKLLVQKGHRVRDVPDYQLALQEIEKGRTGRSPHHRHRHAEARQRHGPALSWQKRVAAAATESALSHRL